MPKHKIVLPRGSYKLCTTNKPDLYEVGAIIHNRRRNLRSEVVLLVELEEDGETRYDVYVIDLSE